MAESSSTNDAIGNTTGGDELSSNQQISQPSNVIVEPSSEIAFKIGKNVAARSSIRITNKSSASVAFKVKTTQPHMYIVKPNQEIIAPYEHADVSVILLDNERDKLIYDTKSASSTDIKKQRFLIQTRLLSDEEANHMKELNGSAKKSEEFAKLFESGKQPVDSLKLKVSFNVDFSAKTHQPQVPAGGPIDSASYFATNNSNNNNNIINNNVFVNSNNNSNSNDTTGLPSSPPKAQTISPFGNISHISDTTTANKPSGSSVGSPPPGDNARSSRGVRSTSGSSVQASSVGTASKDKDGGSNPSAAGSSANSTSSISNAANEELKTELEALKNRFDAVVEYTVHLTTEREEMMIKNEKLEAEVRKEKKKINSNSNNNSTDSSHVGTKTAERVTEKSQQGHTLFQVFLVGLLGFLLGRYFFR